MDQYEKVEDLYEAIKDLRHEIKELQRSKRELLRFLKMTAPYVRHIPECKGYDYGFDVIYLLGSLHPDCRACEIMKYLKLDNPTF